MLRVLAKNIKRKLYTNLTVLENLKIGAYLRKDKNGIVEDLEKVYSLSKLNSLTK